MASTSGVFNFKACIPSYLNPLFLSLTNNNRMSLSQSGSTFNDSTPETSLFEDPYFKETQLDIWQHERKKTMKAIFTIAGILFFSDLVALLMANGLNATTFTYIIIVPLLFIGLGFFANKQPFLSILAATILFAAIIIMNIYLSGAKTIISGLLIKAVVIFFIISGINHARVAEAARKDLDSLR